MVHIVADIGGTKTRLAAVRNTESFEEPIIVSTPQVYEEGIQVISDAAKAVAGDEPIVSVVAGIRGVVSSPEGILVRDSVLSGWSGKAVAADIAERIGATSSILQNDTALVGLGEAHYGAGKGSSIFAYLTISTGVGGVRIVDGLVDASTQGFEIGGQYVELDCATSWEDMISGRAIHAKYGKHPKELGKNHPVWEDLAKITAVGLHNTILHWSPDCVALGGSMMNDIGIPIERIQFHLDAIMKKFPVLPELAHAELGDVGGLWGGLALLNR